MIDLLESIKSPWESAGLSRSRRGRGSPSRAGTWPIV